MNVRHGGQSSTAPLRRVLVCPPDAAGWSHPSQRDHWRDLAYLQEPDPNLARDEHAALVDLLGARGIDVELLAPPEALGLDTVYVHDASLITDGGAICLSMGRPTRRAEPAAHAARYEALGIPVLGRLELPATAEAGDMVWLSESELLIGRGFRTNHAGITRLGELLAPQGIDVISAPLPYGPGPDECLHLMSLLSPLDATTWLVDRPWLAVQTVQELESRGLTLIDIDPAERATLACNVLALGNGELVIFAGNPRTTARLRDRGFTVHEVAGTSMGVCGAGGPTCLTRPLRREATDV